MRCQAWILILALLLWGCGSGREGEPPSAARIPSPAAPLDATGASHSTTPPLKTTAETGALTGVILLKTADGFKPVADIKIAIGETLIDDEGADRVVAYDPSAAPVAYTDAAGRFVFEEIPTGRYGLILDIVLSSFLLYKENSLDAILVDINAGEVTDLGRLEYSELPLPQARR